VRLGIVITSAAAASVTHTTMHVAHAALEQGHAVRVLEPHDLEVDEHGRLRGRAFCLDAPLPDRESLVATLAGRSAPRRSIEVDRLDVLLLRTNPIDLAVMALARLASEAGVRVLNPPDAILATSHKSWLATLPDVPTPPTVVTCSRATAERFASAHEAGVVLKPARACGGRGVGILRGRRRSGLAQAFDEASRLGDGYVVVQPYLPAASLGEKRLLWLDGQLLGGYLRERAPGELRHNLKNGGQPRACVVTDGDRAALRALTPHLSRAGIWFAGVDVIGEQVVEVNTLNPGGVHYTEHFHGQGVATRIVQSLAAQAAPPSLSTAAS
jgi:glutathione synthase